MVTYSGALGAGALANTLVESAPITTELDIVERLQKRGALDCSNAAAYVWSRVTVSF